jgi:hypothetical protein
MGNPRSSEWMVSSASRFNMNDMLPDVMQIVNHFIKIHIKDMSIHSPIIPVEL